jgi:protein-ribulosamine 3-kinase
MSKQISSDDRELAAELAELLAGEGTVVDWQTVGGGCISQARRVRLRDHRGSERLLFVKSQAPSFLQNFRCEADGLAALGAVGAIAVPQTLRVARVGRQAWLVMQWISAQRVASGGDDSDFFTVFGRQLAQLHYLTRGQRIGLQSDNFLGAARQINTSATSWSEFVQQHRLGFQLRWAVDQQLIDRPLQRDLALLIGRLPDLLAGRDDETSLLHGDLWSGNYLCDTTGQAVVIDPAIYYGCREAEFGMLKLFGGCPAVFYDAYQESWPLPPGWQQRARVYVLYHLLNHLNLFGSSYLGRCRCEATAILKAV